MSSLDPITIVLAASTFGTVLTFWAIGLVVASQRRAAVHRRVQARLGDLPDGEARPGTKGARTLRLWHEGKVETRTIATGDRSLSFGERIDSFGRQAGWEKSARSVLALVLLGLVGLVGVVAVITGRFTIGLIAGFTAAAIFWWYATRRIRKKKALFESQLVDAMELAARSLRAGHPLLSSFQLIAKEVPAPVGPLFAEICQEQDVGVPLETSLRNVAASTRSRDMQLFSASMSINVKTGGNLAELVDSLAAVIRDRMSLCRRFRVLSAQTQFSKRVLIALPIIMFVFMSVFQPEYMEMFYGTREGHLLLLFGSGSLIAGWAAMNKMANIEA